MSSSVSPFNFNSTQSNEVNPMVNHFALFQSALNSFNKGALFIGRNKAVKQQLVPLIASARIQLVSQLIDASKRGSTDYAKRLGENLQELTDTTATLCLSKDVAYHIANITPYRG